MVAAKQNSTPKEEVSVLQLKDRSTRVSRIKTSKLLESDGEELRCRRVELYGVNELLPVWWRRLCDEIEQIGASTTS